MSAGNTRKLKKVISGIKVSDGDGVQLTRIIGSTELNMLDPFLLFDVFGTDKPQDYIGGFPSHPHRGFETVTYMFAGKMRHQDSVGNSGVIEAGDVQWMRAGRGINHSEMPEQEEGLLAGTQLWVNLPAAHKMDNPSYQEEAAKNIPEERRGANCRVKVIAGQTQLGTVGVIKNDLVEPLYWDVRLSDQAQFTDTLPEHHNAFIYVIEGELSIANSEIIVSAKQLAVLSSGMQIRIDAHPACRFLLIAGKPINEPVERGGPFVMNTREEIKQAFEDYQSGELASSVSVSTQPDSRDLLR